jgi:uncharacterized membrane-anchored protein
VNANPQARSSAHNGRESKVPEVTLAFWFVKILATTVGETGADAVSMTLHLGYAAASLVFVCFFCAVLAAQLSSTHYRPAVYWAVVVGTTTVGTTVSDFLDRTAGLGYPLSSALLFCGVLGMLLAWYRAEGRIAFENIASRREETFYWVTILVSNTLGTALGDFVASSAGLGFARGALLFGVLLGLLAVAHFLLRRIPTSVLFWSAYVLTRPLGATLGDTITKPAAGGGLGLGRITTSLAIAAVMIAAIFCIARISRAEPARGPSS